MPRKTWTLVMAASLAAGCGAVKSSDQAEKEALEQRVAELERRLLEAEKPAEATPAPARAAVAAPSPRRPVAVAAEPTPAPRPEAEPEAPRMAPVIEGAPPTPALPPPLVIAEGTTLELILEDGLSSRTSRAGDRVVARIERATSPDGEVALPGGSFLEGRVVEARESGRVKGKARVDVAFDKIVVRGKRYSVEASGLSLVADDSHKRDAGIVAGSAAAGAILGAITGGSATKGAVLGGAAGGGAVLATKGKEIELPAGSPASVRVTRERVIG
ncbi:MAG TPA: hypothetical protein VFM88_12445 [Vicinamibacteria bacterium]|nr:hypothetical protein [Vicinamibacteria bacterium]